MIRLAPLRAVILEAVEEQLEELGEADWPAINCIFKEQGAFQGASQ